MTAGGVLPGPEPVPMPPDWFDGPLPALTEPAHCAAALTDTAAHLRKIVTRAPSHSARAFQEQLLDALDSDAAHLTITFPRHVPPPVACTLLAAWLGLPPASVHDDIGGTVSHVVSGAGHRHDQAWHTDSTAWLLPNRFSLLGLCSTPGGQDLPTGVMPVRHLDHFLHDDQEALAALRSETLPWRVNFPDLPQLWGSVLDPAVPRWVRPAVDPLRERMSPALARGVQRLETALAGQVPWYEPSTAAGRLVMFDNHRVLHRGPQAEASSGRELVRIKIGGRALP